MLETATKKKSAVERETKSQQARATRKQTRQNVSVRHSEEKQTTTRKKIK
jgi:hypothetical protein